MELSVNPFLKIFSSSEKNKIWHEIKGTKGVIICKSDKEDFFLVQIIDVGENGKIQGKIRRKLGQSEGSVAVVGNFQTENEKLFFQTEAIIENHFIYWNLDGDLYRLQRRGTFRVNTQSKKDIYFRIRRWGNSLVDVTAEVLDFSSGGLKFQIEAKTGGGFEAEPCTNVEELGKNFKKNSLNNEYSFQSLSWDLATVIDGYVQLGSQKGLDIQAEIRHSRPGIYAGIEFKNTSPQMKNRLQMSALDLQKEIIQMDEQASERKERAISGLDIIGDSDTLEKK